MNESEFWIIQSEVAIGMRIAPRFRISLSSLNEKTFWKLFQIRATHPRVAAQVPIVWPMIAPFTPAPIERITMIAVMLNAGRAASMSANVIARPSNQITISASLKIAQTAPVIVANRTTGPWLES